MEILWFLLIGLISGWFAAQIMKGGGYGIVGDVIIGISGSFIGGYLFLFLDITTYGTVGSIVMAVVGAVVLIGLLRVLKHA